MIRAIIFGLWSLVFGLAMPAAADVTLKVSASNPSEYNEQTVPIKSYLPRGIQPEHVVDAGGLEVGYDVKQGQCYVYTEVVLPVKGTVSYDVRIQDIWLIVPEDLEKHRDYARQLRDQLQESDYAQVSSEVTEAVEKKIETILDRQEENLVEKVSPIEHIGAYDLNKETLAQVKEDISTLENMLIALMKAGASAGAKGGRPAAGGRPSVKETAQEPLKDPSAGVLQTEEGYEQDSELLITELGKIAGAGCLSREAALYAKAQGISLEKPESVGLTVGIENPSATESQTLPLKYYFPEEVKSNDVLEAGELKVGFDFEKSLFYVFKPEVLLEPAQKKTFEVILKDKWSIDRFYLLTLKVHAENMMTAMQGKEGFDAVRQAGEDLRKGIDELLEREPAGELTEERIAFFRNDQRKVAEMERKIEEMEEVLIGAGVVAAMTADQKEKLCEETREKKALAEASGSEGSEVMKEFKLVAGTIFKGKSPSTAATWKVIFGIIVFLGVLSSTFYYVQIKAHKSTMLDTLTGVFSRGYVTERFREELRIARETKTKCSLLVLDIDKFKSINDTYGHAVGDIVIKEFVIAIRKGVRATDLVGRLGGDEFLIILPTGDKERGRKIAEGINRIVEKHPIKVKDQEVLITTSIGVATFPDDSGTADDMFNKADAALYETKRKGGNGVSTV